MVELFDIKEAETIIASFVNAISKNHSYETWKEDEYTRFFIIDEDLPIVVTIYKPHFFVTEPYELHIRELAPNINNVEIDFKGIEHFKGLEYSYGTYDQKPYLEYMRKYPKLKMKEKYDEWEGWLTNYAIIKMVAKDGTKEYGVGHFPYLPSKFMKQFEECLMAGCRPDNGSFSHNNRYGLYEAYKSWKGEERAKRFENHATYLVIRELFKEKLDIYQYAEVLLEAAYRGEFDTQDFNSYVHPTNRWTSEETVFKICQKMFGKKNVIYQYRPPFLKSPKNGQMSYDIFIPSLNVAIEYQGLQHFKPIDFFGGEEAFHNLVQRDKAKQELSKQNNVNLIYINYDEVICEDLIEEKINIVSLKKH